MHILCCSAIVVPSSPQTWHSHFCFIVMSLVHPIGNITQIKTEVHCPRYQENWQQIVRFTLMQTFTDTYACFLFLPHDSVQPMGHYVFPALFISWSTGFYFGSNFCMKWWGSEAKVTGYYWKPVVLPYMGKAQVFIQDDCRSLNGILLLGGRILLAEEICKIFLLQSLFCVHCRQCILLTREDVSCCVRSVSRESG